jgi:hypothetical protein
VDFPAATIFSRFGKIQEQSSRSGKIQNRRVVWKSPKSMIRLGVREKTSTGARAPMTIQQHQVGRGATTLSRAVRRL